METNKNNKNEGSNIINDNVHIDKSDDVLDLDELFGVQGGVNTDENDEHLEETCGLGCFEQRHVIIRKGNGTK
ncbi:hypothetical protein [Bacteroides caecigallinarum]|uniref:hypothetical protein n=1 Tax=Bacteroides caecigallinarum TaxID=1411144 RepID=UPI0019595987|nr:hypothetical protein [Bacteroides caecigallinarum]MBM6883934.1 hypothetical protein [Bacteroides caecigallinarum]